MKKNLAWILLFLLMPAAVYSQFTHVGLQAAYSSKVKEPGFGVHAIYRVNDEIKITPNALYYIPHKINTLQGTQTYEWWAVNLDGDYVVVNQGIFEGYGLMGLNFMHVTGKRDEVVSGEDFEDKRSFLKLGLNTGAGMRMNIGDRVVPFGEVRFTVGGKTEFADWGEVSTTQFGIFAGVLIRIAENKDRTAEEEF